MQGGLVLRDVHRPPPPPLWPPAPGWWWVGLTLAIVVALLVYLRRRREQRRRAVRALFDGALDRSETPAARLAAASEMLRRAARLMRPDADRLEGDDWLALLDTPRTRFIEGPGRLLLDGPFRPHIDAADADAAVALARARFVELMGRR